MYVCPCLPQGSIVERIKLESGRLRQQLRESQERALRDKEQLARHLEAIQQDMMEREAAFQDIQRERLMIEDTFNTQVGGCVTSSTYRNEPMVTVARSTANCHLKVNHS